MFKLRLEIVFCIGYYELFKTFVWPHLANLLLSELKKLHFWIPLNARSTVHISSRLYDRVTKRNVDKTECDIFTYDETEWTKRNV